MRFALRQLCPKAPMLAGALDGRALLSNLVGAAVGDVAGEPCFLDFEGIEIATASFLRESVLAYREFALNQSPAIYPVVANANEGVCEELKLLLAIRSDAIWTCVLDTDGHISRPRILGSLDPAHRETFDIVTEHKEVDAPTLARTAGHPVGTTAWNNRLAALARRGLLMERSRGKLKLYSPLLEGK